MRRALGRGLSQLAADQFDLEPTDAAVSSIAPNPRQPRKHFNEEALAELAASIKEYGVLQPIVVMGSSNGTYELIAGERRLRAAKLAGLTRVPIVIRQAGDQLSLELALIENIQREDISPVECARAYQRLMLEFDLTQEDVARKVGKSRAGVANTIRLLKLSSTILDGLEAEKITEGHAKALLAFETEPQQLAVYNEILARGLTVRDVERLAQVQAASKVKKPSAKPSHQHEFYEIESTLSMQFGAPVRILRKKGVGHLTIEFFSDEDLQRILDGLGSL